MEENMILLENELTKTLKVLSKTKDPKDRKLHAETISILTNSFSILMETASNIMDNMEGFEEEYDEEDIPF